MKLLKICIATVFLMVILPAFAFAQTGQVTTKIASVNIQNVQISNQENNVFTITFELNNKEGVQSGVKYGVQLLGGTGAGQYIADEKVYDETLTLSENTAVKREISYTAPTSISGTYTIFLVSFNSSGFPFSIATAGNVTFSASQKGIVVMADTCKVQAGAGVPVADGQTPVVNPGQAVTIVCNAVNNADVSLTATPAYETHLRSLFGEQVTQTGGTAGTVSFAPHETKSVVFTLPTVQQPQVYEAKAWLTANGSASNSVITRYIVAGTNGTVQNATLNKTQYKKGEVATVGIVWGASSTDPAMNTAKAKATPDIALTTRITTASGRACAAPVNQMLARGDTRPITEVRVSMTSACFNPRVSVTLSDKSGTVLDQKEFSFASSGQQFSTKTVAIVLIVIVVLLIVGVLVKMKSKMNRVPTQSALIFFIAIGLLSIAPLNTAHADTYRSTNYNDILTAVGGLSSNGYAPGATINVSAYIQNDSTTAQYTVVLNASTSGSSVEVIPQTTINPGSQTSIYQEHLTAPSSPGSYTVAFTTGVDVVSGPGPTITSYSAGQGYTEIGTPSWEVSFGLDQPATQDGNAQIQFNYTNGTSTDPTAYGSGTRTIELDITAGSWGGATAPTDPNEIQPHNSGAVYSVSNVCIASSTYNVKPADKC